MSSMNITNLLIRLAATTKLSQNNVILNQNNNANQNNSVNVRPNPSTPNLVNPNLNLNNNVNNVLNQSFIHNQLMNNIAQANVAKPFVPFNNAVANNVVAYTPVMNNTQAGQQVLGQNTGLPVMAASQNLGRGTLSSVLQPQILNSLTTQQLQTPALVERNQNITFVKDMMKLPQQMNEVLNMVQVAQTAQTAQAKTSPETRMLLLSNIDLRALTQVIQNGSKEALNAIGLAAAANLTKADAKMIDEAVSYLNMSASSVESQTQALKNFMLLYLPWLPLQEGMDFELDFSFSKGSDEEDENILNIVIMTRNFGEIHILIILKALNSFEIYVQCCSEFPKKTLLKLVGDDEKKFSLQTNITFETQENVAPKSQPKEAKITLSHVKEISPFLLLIANSLIKNTFVLDSQRG